MRSKSSTTGKAIWILSLFCCLVLTAAGLWKTLFISADIDEAYALAIAQRLAGGDRLLLQMWEPHQLSAVLYALPVALYQMVAGPYARGILLFMRTLGFLIQLILAVWIYRELSGKGRSLTALWIAFLYLNFTPKQIQSPEFNILFYWALTALILLLAKEGTKVRYAGMGLALCVMVLCYPTAVLVFLYVFVFIYVRGKKEGAKGIKNPSFLFGGVCICAAALLLLAMILTGDFGAAVSNIGNVLSDASHEQSFSQLWLWHAETLFGILTVTGGMLVVILSGSRVLDRKGNKECLFWGAVLLLQALWMIWQFHSWQEKVYYDFLPLLCQLTLMGIALGMGRNAALKGRGLFPVTLLSMFSVMSLSNLPADYSCGMLMPYLLLVVLPLLTERVRRGVQEKETGALFFRCSALVLFLVLTLQVVTVRCVLVRFSGNQRRNIFETYYREEHGPVAGIRLSGDEWMHYDDLLHARVEGVKEDDRVLFVGASFFFYSLLTPEQIATGNTISSPVYDGQLLAYYEAFPQRLPTVLVLDGGYVENYASFMEKEPFASFVRERFDLEDPLVCGSVVVYHLR